MFHFSLVKRNNFVYNDNIYQYLIKIKVFFISNLFFLSMALTLNKKLQSSLKVNSLKNRNY